MMENKMRDFIFEFNKNENLRRKFLNAKSLKESYGLLKDEFSNTFQNYTDYKNFMNKMHEIGLRYENQLSESDLELISGGVQNKFLAACLSGLMTFSSIGSITTNVGAWDSGTTAVHSSEDDYKGDIPRKQLFANNTEWLAKITGSNHQPVHESITDYSWRLNFPDEPIPAALELGSVWNDLMSNSTANFGLNYMLKDSLPGTENMYDKGYEGLSDEIDHLLLTQINCCSENVRDEISNKSFLKKIWEEIKSNCSTIQNKITGQTIGSINARFSHNGRGNYLHCMNCVEGKEKKLAGQSKTYKLIVSWLEAALAYATYGMNIVNMPEELRTKVDPRIKKLIMGMGDIVRFAKNQMSKDSEYKDQLKKGIAKFLHENKKKWISQSAKNDKRYLSCCILEGEYYASQSASIELDDVDVDEAEKIIGFIEEYSSEKGERHDEEYYKYRALGMACHTIEDSYNPAHCDRVVTYNADGVSASLGKIKSFLNYDSQSVEGHGEFDKVRQEELVLLKNMSAKNASGVSDALSELKTLGLKDSVNAVKTLIGNMKTVMESKEIEDLKKEMERIVSDVICFDEKIASSSEYIPYKLMPNVECAIEAEGTYSYTGEYIDYVTPDGGRLAGEIENLINFAAFNKESLEVYSKDLNALKLCLEKEKANVLEQNYKAAKQWASLGYFYVNQLFNPKLKPGEAITIQDGFFKARELLRNDYRVSGLEPATEKDASSNEELLTVSWFNPYAVQATDGNSQLEFYVLDEKALRAGKLYNQYMDALKDEFEFEKNHEKDKNKDKNEKYRYLVVKAALARCLFIGDMKSYNEIISQYKEMVEKKESEESEKNEIWKNLKETMTRVKVDWKSNRENMYVGPLSNFDKDTISNDLLTFSNFAVVNNYDDQLKLLEQQHKRAEALVKQDGRFKPLERVTEFFYGILFNGLDFVNSDYECLDTNSSREGVFKEKLAKKIKEKWKKLMENREEELRAKIYVNHSYDEILKFLEINLQYLEEIYKTDGELKECFNEINAHLKELKEEVKQGSYAIVNVKTVLLASAASYWIKAVNSDNKDKMPKKELKNYRNLLEKYETVREMEAKLNEKIKGLDDNGKRELEEFQNSKRPTIRLNYDANKIQTKLSPLEKAKWIIMMIYNIGINFSGASELWNANKETI